MKRKTSSLLLIFMMFISIFSIGFATWIISFDKNFDANYTPQADININNLYNQKLTYNGLDRKNNLNTSVLDNVMKDYSFVVKKDNVSVTEVKDAGNYEFIYTSKKQNFDPFTIRLTIEPITVDAIFTVSYDGKSKEYVNNYDIHHYDKYNATPKNMVTVSAKVSGMLGNDICNVDIKEKGAAHTPFDFGVNKTFDLSLSGQHAHNYRLRQNKLNIIAKQKVILKQRLIEINYDSTYLADIASTQISNYITNNCLFNEDNTKFDASQMVCVPVVYMHNGTYVYPTNYKGDLGFTPEVCESVKMVGSTYIVHLNFYDDKFEVIQESSNLVNTFDVHLKYKTAMIGNSYFTIEDAFMQSDTISFAGDSSSSTSYVPTAFTALDYYGLNTYELKDGRKLLVPFEASLNEIDPKSNMTSTTISYNTYSALYIPKKITINVLNGSSLVTGGQIHGTQHLNGFTKIHGTIMNNGCINVNNSHVRSYGYIKGLHVKESNKEYGIINATNNSSIEDVFTLYNFPGGNHSKNMHNDVFPVSNYSFHNISTMTRIDKTSILTALWRIAPSNGEFEGKVTLLGGNGLFTLTSNVGYIEKYATNIFIDKQKNTFNEYDVDSNGKGINTSVTMNNHGDSKKELCQKDIINIYGDFRDNSIEINIKVLFVINVTLKTSTSIGLPIGFLNINIMEGKGYLQANSYKFLPGSSVYVAPGATLETASNVHFMAYDETFINKCNTSNLDNWSFGYKLVHSDYLNLQNDKIGAKIINDGVFLSNGYFGGCLKTNNIGATSILKNVTATIKETINDNDQFANFTESAYGLISDTTSYSKQNFVAGNQYNSEQSSDGTYHWSKPTTPKKFTINYYDKDSTTPSSVDVYMNSDNASLTGNEYIPEKLYYDFKYWCTDSTLNTPFNGRNDIKPNEVINLYAKYDLHIYKIDYHFGYNDELIKDLNSISGDKSVMYFTFDGNNFIYWTDPNNKSQPLNKITLPSGYTYTMQDGSIKQEETGWHVGILGLEHTPETIVELTAQQFKEWVTKSNNMDLQLTKLFVDHLITLTGTDNNVVDTEIIPVKDGAKLSDISQKITQFNRKHNGLWTHFSCDTNNDGIDEEYYINDNDSTVYDKIIINRNMTFTFIQKRINVKFTVYKGDSGKDSAYGVYISSEPVKPLKTSSLLNNNSYNHKKDCPLRADEENERGNINYIDAEFKYGTQVTFKFSGRKYKQGWFGSGSWEKQIISKYFINSVKKDVGAVDCNIVDLTLTENLDIIIHIQP